MNEASVNIKISTITNLCRDEKDNYLLSIAIDSDADFLLTGDNDLLELVKLNNTIILNFNDFEKIII